MARPQRTSSPPILSRLITFSVLTVLVVCQAMVFGTLWAQLVPGLGAENGTLLIVAAAVFVVSWICTRQFDRRSVRGIGIGFDRPWLSQLAAGALLGCALVAFAWLLFLWLGWVSWRVNPVRDGQFQLITLGLLNCAATAFFEELLCRGYAFQIVARRNLFVGLVLTGLLFVGIHLMNTGGSEPLALINVFLGHVMFAACYLRTRSLWFPIGLHTAWNFMETVVLGLPYNAEHRAGAVLITDLQQNVWTGFRFGLEGGLIGTAIVVGTTLVIWRCVKQRRPAEDLLVATGDEPSRRPQVDPLNPPAPALCESKPASTRILALDVLRGVAILGILPLNMQLFGLVAPAYYYPYAVDFMDSTNLSIWVGTRILIGNKDLSIFSMLFGAGILMIDSRSIANGVSAARMHYRRMAVLLVLGLVHAYTLYFGDILFTYAVCGFIVYQLRRALPRVQIAVGVLAYLVPVSLLGVAHLVAPKLNPEMMRVCSQAFRPNPEFVAETYAAYSGSWLDQIGQRFGDALGNQTFGLVAGMAWITGGMMLVGMGLYRLGYFTGERSDRSYGRMFAIAALVGYPLLVFSFVWNFRHDWRWPDGILLGWVLREIAYGIIAFAWVGGIMLICRHGVLKRLTNAIGAVGRLALSNYLAQSVICGFIFYGHGLGLIGQVDYVDIAEMTLAIWVLLIVASSIWLRFYRLGPAEWLWRKLAHRWRAPARGGALTAS